MQTSGRSCCENTAVYLLFEIWNWKLAPFAQTPLSTPRLTGDPVFQRRQRFNREAAAYWIARSSRAMTAVFVSSTTVGPAVGTERTRNDGSGISIRISNSGYTSAFSRREAPEVCVSLSLKRGSRECRMRAAPAVSRAKGRTKIAHEHTGQRRQSDIPCAMALRLISRSPRSIGLSCLRRLPETGTLARLGFRTSVET